MHRIPVAKPLLTPREAELVAECVHSGWVSSRGRFITEFEQRFAAFCGRRFGVATSNGTTALHLVLSALGLGPGDEVVVPALTFVATANAVAYTGARVVFADCNPRSWCMEPASLSRAITPATKGVIVVHLYGQPADMNSILSIAEQRGLWVVEDAAQAHGAEVRVGGRWRKVGSMGLASCFSFYGNKIITTGEGGMVLTDDEELARRMRLLRDHAMDPNRPYWHPVRGYNYRMTNMQAALGVGQMERVEQILERKREIAEHYYQGLEGITGLVLPPRVETTRAVWWMFSVVVEEDFGMDRDELRQWLHDRGVETRPFFVPLNLLPPYEGGPRMPVAERLGQRGLNLPSGPEISPQEIDRVCELVHEAQRAGRRG